MSDDPDLRLLGFSLWVDRRQFSDASDYWDSNWLIVRARMEANGACVERNGPILMTTDVQQFRDELAVMAATLGGEAFLAPLEPDLKIAFVMRGMGQVEVTIEMTPDQFTQHHRFTLGVDQSYLPAMITACDALLARFPVLNVDADR